MIFHKSGAALSACAIGLASALPAQADDAQMVPAHDEIVVTATIERPAGQTLTSIDQSRFENSPAFTIGQVLQYSPGVTIKQGNGPRDVGISIRGSGARNGFGVRNIVVFEDGFPVTQPDGLSRTDLTDPHAYSGIDVYRGPSSALYGNYATGGAVNFRTRAGGQIDGFEVGADGGKFGYLNGYVTAGQRLGGFAPTDISAPATSIRQRSICWPVTARRLTTSSLSNSSTTTSILNLRSANRSINTASTHTRLAARRRRMLRRAAVQ